MNYIIHLLIMIGIYLIQVQGFNLLFGFGGLLSLCQAVFYGIGAYATSLAIIHFHLSFFPALACSVLLTGGIAATIGLVALRFRGESFVIVSLGLQMIVYSIIYNWVSVTRGPYGIPGIPRPEIFSWQANSLSGYLALTAVILGLVLVVIRVLHHSPFGLALKALRDNELAAEGLGKAPVRLLLWAFVVAAICGAISGGLYATYVTYIDPTSFTLDESIFLVSILLVGGAGNIKGPILGTMFMLLLPEGLRYIGLPDAIAPNVRQMIYGCLLIGLMFFRPQGIAGEYRVRRGG